MRASGLSPIGLDVGAARVKAVQLHRRGDGVRVVAAACFPRLEPGAAPSERELARAAGVLDRRGFAGRRCVMGMARGAILTAELELPPAGSGAPREQIARLEMARVHKREPGGFEMGLWEIPAPARSGPGAHALGVACPHECAEEVLENAERAGLDVGALDHPGCALARLARRGGARTRAILDLGWSGAVISLVRDGAVMYERVIEGGSLEALHAALRSQTGFDGVALEALVAGGPWMPREDVRRGRHLADRTARCVNAYAESVGRELKLSLTYLAQRFPAVEWGPGESLPAVDVVGGGAACEGLMERLAPHAPAALRVLRVTDVLSVDDAAIAAGASPALTLAAGLAARDGEGGA